MPLRLVLGAKECRAGTVSVKTRIATTTGDSAALSSSGAAAAVMVPQASVVPHVQEQLQLVQTALFQRATEHLVTNTTFHATYASLLAAVAAGQQQQGSQTTMDSSGDSKVRDSNEEEEEEEVTSGLGFYLAPWHPSASNEKQIKTDSKLTIRCYPDDTNFVPGAVWSHYRPLLEKVRRGELACFFDNEKTATELALFARNF